MTGRVTRLVLTAATVGTGPTVWAQIWKVPASTVGDVTFECKNPSSWRFEFEPTVGDGADDIRIRMVSETEATPPLFSAVFGVDVAGTEHVWTANCFENYELWPWSWRDRWLKYSALAYETPIAVGFDYDEHATVSIAASEVFEKVLFGLNVKETTARIQGEFVFFSDYATPRRIYETHIRIDTRRRFWADAVRDASSWISSVSGFKSPKPPEAAFDSLYSTWYAFFQDVHAEALEREAELAASLGMKTMILDDGWQKVASVTPYSATGDWMPVPSRFPDMKAHVAAVHRAGLRYMLWVSVPYVGDESKVWTRFRNKMLYFEGETSPGVVGVLDPRFPDVREYLITTYERIIGEWGFDGIKLDFIDQFAYVRDDPALKDDYAGRDCKSIPAAVDRLMTDILSRLKRLNPNVMVEFRQHYMGPAILKYGHMIRALDTPAEPSVNRKRICDLRLTSGDLAVHSDMIVWNRCESPEGAAIPILNALFSTIQYSMALAKASEKHRDVIRHWISFAERHRETLQRGTFRPRHPECRFPSIESESEKERISAVYNGDVVSTVFGAKDEYVVNATSSDALTLDLRRDCDYASFDVFGNHKGEGTVRTGLRRMAFPRSGYVRFSPRKRIGQ